MSQIPEISDKNLFGFYEGQPFIGKIWLLSSTQVLRCVKDS